MGEESPEDRAGEVYHPDEDEEEELSTVIMKTIERQQRELLPEAEFRLYDDINPDALNNLFRDDARGGTTVKFTTDGVTVTLWGDGAIAIKVAPRETD